MSKKNPQQALKRIIDVMAKLRDPLQGCPWDLKQTWHSLIAHTLEEAYEVADAIEGSEAETTSQNVAEELGDLLFQVVFYARIAEEQNLFDLQDVIHRLCDKLEQRHPHVFSNANYTESDLDQAWHQVKAEERKSKQLNSVLDDIPLALPALTRAQKLQNRASNEGFDWKDYHGVFDKLAEETLELKQAIESQQIDAIEDEMGDLLFTAVNLARKLNLDAETCLRKASTKFEQRYRLVETELTVVDKVVDKVENKKISDYSEQQLLTSWERAKRTLKK